MIGDGARSDQLGENRPEPGSAGDRATATEHGGPGPRDGFDHERRLPTLVVQSVLFHPDRCSLRRFAAGLAAAVTRAQRSDMLGEVTLAVADNTPHGPGEPGPLGHLGEPDYRPSEPGSRGHPGESSPPPVEPGPLGHLGEPSPRLGEPGSHLDAFRALEAAGVALRPVLERPDNPGHGGAHNALARTTSSDLLLLVNPDTVASATLLVELLSGLDDTSWAPGRVGMVEARQLPLELPKVFDPGTGDTPWASAACLLVCRALFEHLGGFDAGSFFLHCDDVDLSWRARLAGARIVHRPTAVVFHDKRLTDTGHLVVPDVEHRWSAEGALTLAYRYGHRALLDQLLATYRAGNPAQRAAVDAFEARRDAGVLPEVLDPQHQVSQVARGSWSALRFGLEPAGVR